MLAERVFHQAKMTDAISETGQRLMPGRAMPYRLGAADRQVVVKSAPHKDLRFLTGAGSVYATAADLLHFVHATRRGVFGSSLSEKVFGDEPTRWHDWTGRTSGYDASVDVLSSEDVTFVLLSNLRSAANWQLREQIQNIILRQPTVPIPFPPPVAEPFEQPESLVGSYGPAEITHVDDRLLRGDNEFYPLEGKRYYIPASGFVMRFRRDSAGVVDALSPSEAEDGRESYPRQADGDADSPRWFSSENGADMVI